MRSKRKKDHILRAAAKIFKAFGEPEGKESPKALVPYSPAFSPTASQPISEMEASKDYRPRLELRNSDNRNKRMNVSVNEEDDKDRCESHDYEKTQLGKVSYPLMQKERGIVPQHSLQQPRIRSEDSNSNIFASQTDSLRLKLENSDDSDECITLSHGLDDTLGKDSKEHGLNSSDEEMKYSSQESSMSEKSVSSCVSVKSCHLVRLYEQRCRVRSSLSWKCLPAKEPK